MIPCAVMFFILSAYPVSHLGQNSDMYRS